MKKIIIIIFLPVAVFACNKSNPSLQHKITGKWELREEMGGFAGNIQYPAGNGNTFEFDNSGKFKQMISSGVDQSGTYRLNKTNVSGDWILQLNYDSSNRVDRDSVRFENNKLIFLPAESCCDIPTVIYVKNNLLF